MTSLRDGEVEDVELQHLRAAPVLRGVPARPRLHRGARHHRPHLRHLPGRLPDELRAMRWRTRCGVEVAEPARDAPAAALLRRVDREPRAARLSCCTRPTSSATRAPSRWRSDHRESCERALELKKAGNELMALVGGREIHPINVAVGGFYRAPRKRELAPLRRAAGARAGDRRSRPSAGSRASTSPTSSATTSSSSLRQPGEYPIDRGRSSRTAGLDIALQRLRRRTSRSCMSRTRTRCIRGSRERGAYLVGPLARYSLNFDRLSPLAQRGGA